LRHFQIQENKAGPALDQGMGLRSGLVAFRSHVASLRIGTKKNMLSVSDTRMNGWACLRLR